MLKQRPDNSRSDVAALGKSGIHHHLSLILGAWMLTLCLCGSAAAQAERLVVRMARLQIDPAQLSSYQAALKQEIKASVRLEPGVLSLSAVSEKSNPTHVTILEIYANEDAYKAHLAAPHFKKYKAATKTMVKSLQLIESIPIALAAKGNR